MVFGVYHTILSPYAIAPSGNEKASIFYCGNLYCNFCLALWKNIKYFLSAPSSRGGFGYVDRPLFPSATGANADSLDWWKFNWNSDIILYWPKDSFCRVCVRIVCRN